MKGGYLRSSAVSAVSLGWLAVIISTVACTQASAPTPTLTEKEAQATDTRLGKLNFEQGFPTEETAKKLFDEMDYQRAVQAYLWAYPAVSFESIRLAAKRDLGAELNDLVIADN